MDSFDRSKTEKIRTEAHDWVVALEELPVSDMDRKRFEQWLDADPRHAESYDRAVTVRSAIATLDFEDIDSDLRRSYQTIRTDSRLLRRLRFLRQPKWTMGAGGALAVALAIAAILLQPPNPPALSSEPVVFASYESSVGERKEVTLPDGTITLLDGNTALAIEFSDDKRRITLQSGAAFFDVAADIDRPFSVESGNLSAVALGTRFDVRAGAQVYRVGVEEGEVEVRYPVTIGGRMTGVIDTRSLVPGQTVAATRRDGMGRTEQEDPANIAAWRYDRLIFRGATIAEFVANLNRRSTVTIALDPADTFSDLKIDGAFVGDDVDRFLLALTEMHPVEVDRSDPSVFLIRRR